MNYALSLFDPEKIDENNLPSFDLITDLNNLANIENDYLNLIHEAKS